MPTQNATLTAPQMALSCLPNPCDSCPYRRDVAPGIWDRSEYVKLPQWDEQMAVAGTFLCHNGDAKTTICRGWMEVHERNMAVRMAMFRVKWDDTNRKPTKCPLFRSGLEAMRHGLSGVKKPGRVACESIVKILKRRTRRARSVGQRNENQPAAPRNPKSASLSSPKDTGESKESGGQS